jgi:hypothetical protein
MFENRDWWPAILIQLHKHEWVNFPPAIDSIMSGLIVHSASYLLADQNAGAVIRAESVKAIVESAQSMDRLHDEAMKQLSGKGNALNTGQKNLSGAGVNA